VTDTVAKETDPGSRPPAPSAPPGRTPWSLIGLIGFIVFLGIIGGWPIVVVVLALIVMIFMHELGHYLMAKSAGMKVTEFFLGFGPRLWSFRRGETEYGVKAIPAGAYVKIIGMNNLEDVPPEDEPRTYRQQPFWRRLSVAVAGSAMHFLMALVCIFVFLATTGVRGGELFPTAAEFDRAQTRAENTGNWTIADVQPGSPADRAGIEVNDKVVVFDGQPVTSFSQVRKAVQGSKGDTVDIVVLRKGVRDTVQATIGTSQVNHDWGFLGVGADPPLERTSVAGAAVQAPRELGRLMTQSVQALGHVFSPSGLHNFASQVAAGPQSKNAEANDSQGNSGSAGSGTTTSASNAKNEDRPLSIYGAVGIGADLTRHGITYLFLFLAMINVFVGVFNMIPLLPLDGGHVAIAIYERIRSRRGRPYHADVAKLLPLTYAVVMVLVLIGVTALYLDVVSPVT
jgi:membrane-associated protease RseP (regulator of RpoE activity)